MRSAARIPAAHARSLGERVCHAMVWFARTACNRRREGTGPQPVPAVGLVAGAQDARKMWPLRAAPRLARPARGLGGGDALDGPSTCSGPWCVPGPRDASVAVPRRACPISRRARLVVCARLLRGSSPALGSLPALGSSPALGSRAARVPPGSRAPPGRRGRSSARAHGAKGPASDQPSMCPEGLQRLDEVRFGATQEPRSRSRDSRFWPRVAGRTRPDVAPQTHPGENTRAVALAAVPHLHMQHPWASR